MSDYQLYPLDLRLINEDGDILNFHGRSKSNPAMPFILDQISRVADIEPQHSA